MHRERERERERNVPSYKTSAPPCSLGAGASDRGIDLNIAVCIWRAVGVACITCSVIRACREAAMKSLSFVCIDSAHTA
jgi:hypothetical protein